MPADRLIPVVPGPAPTATGKAVLDVLAGGDRHAAAERAGLALGDLADAIEIFQHAGHDALAERANHEWQQLYLHFTAWPHADETAAAHLLPLMRTAHDGDGQPVDWWFTRKHPCWRLRLRIGPESTKVLHEGFDQLVAGGHLHRWWQGTYETETAAFGGSASMTAAHDLFTVDSHHILHPPGRADLGVGRRELSVLLCTALMRAAGCEWYEQGDVWQRVISEEQRSHTHAIDPEKLHALAGQLRTLLTTDITPDGPLLSPGGPLVPVAGWFEAFRRTGLALTEAVRAGELDRGLRRVLSLHIIFHWNRLGLSLGAQSALAWAARTAILDPSGTSVAFGSEPAR